MKVLWQDWNFLLGGQMSSLSKDREQLDQTIKEIAPKPDPEWEGEFLNERDALTPDGEAAEIEIPDNASVIELIQCHTVFLREDEMHLIWDNLPDQE